MDTLHILFCLFAGWIPSLFLSGVIVKPFTAAEKDTRSVILCFLCIALLAAIGSFLWIHWNYNAIGFVVGILLTFLPYVRTPADREEEKKQ